MKTDTARSMEAFETLHGGAKIAELKQQVAIEQAKVDKLAGVQNVIHVEHSDDCTLRFAVIGDTHLGNLHYHEAAFTAFLRICEAEGIMDVFHAGDVLDGHKVYRGQEFDLRDVGLDKQVGRLVSSVPELDLDVHFITGNHDASFKHAAGVSVGKAISDAMPRWDFLGEDQARYRWETPNGPFELMLLHPDGGSSYALSYRPQKIIESLEGGSKPDMLAIGHYHKADFLPTYRNVAAIQTGTFERQTDFMARKGLAAHVGGWIVEVEVGDGWKSITTKFIAFYV